MKKRAAYGYIDTSEETKRLNRVIGQVEGIQSMIKDQRKLKDVLAQCKAAQSALKSIETRLVKAHLEAAFESIAKIEKKKERAEKLAELEDLFKKAS